MEKLTTFLIILAKSLIIAFAFAGILMWLWNAVIVILFSTPVINYWQAFGLYIISNILFCKINVGDKLNDKN